MAAPKLNQFWKARSKHGRDLIFASPTILWEAACEYFQWVDENPLKENGWMKSKRDVMRAYSFTGLCLFLDVNSAFFRQFKESTIGKQEDFSTILTRIEDVVFTQKFEGAAAGLLNHNIIARDLGLVDKSEGKNQNKNINYDVLVNKEEIVDIAKTLEGEY